MWDPACRLSSSSSWNKKRCHSNWNGCVRKYVSSGGSESHPSSSRRYIADACKCNSLRRRFDDRTDDLRSNEIAVVRRIDAFEQTHSSHERENQRPGGSEYLPHSAFRLSCSCPGPGRSGIEIRSDEGELGLFFHWWWDAPDHHLYDDRS